MEEHADGNTSSKVPQHLTRFHHGSRSCSDLISGEAPYSYSFAPKPANAVELCPPHWRRPERQPLKKKLRAILLKDWHSLRLESALPQPVQKRTPERPKMNRMKDSDDYITARGANPRTGLISPSVGSPCTPESPAEALKLRKVPASPTPEVRRPLLKTANEGRKVSAGRGVPVLANGNAWTVDGVGAVASPRVTTEDVEGDRFVINMPSATEPQPYAFPGYSAQQIKAFAHYKDKARRVSGEGYDQRILQAASSASGSLDKEQDAAQEQICPHPVRAFSGETVPAPNRDVPVLKQRARLPEREDIDPETARSGGADLRAATFAPFSSPKTPAVRSNQMMTTTLTTFAPSIHGQNQLKIHKPIARKPLPGSGEKGALPDLPPVKLAHPSVAGLPLPQHGASRQHANMELRKCPFGCHKEAKNGICMASSSRAALRERVPLFDDSDPAAMSPSGTRDTQDTLHILYYISDILIGTLVALFELSKHVQLPSISLPVLETLRSEHAPAAEKVEAMKTVVYATGQTLGLITAVVMLWNLGSGLVRLLEVIFRPLSVPVRVVRWVVGV